MNRIIHCCVDLGAIIKRRPGMLDFLRHFNVEANALSDDAMVTRAVIMQAQGFEAWPLCDNFDKTGHCKGHPSDGP